MAVGISPTVNEFQFTPPKALFKTRMLAVASVFHEFDVTADGQRFLIGTLIGDTKISAAKNNLELARSFEEVVVGVALSGHPRSD